MSETESRAPRLTEGLSADGEQIEAFLTGCLDLGRKNGQARVSLSAIRPGRSTVPSQTFTDPASAAAWIAARNNAQAEAYFSIGEPRDEIERKLRNTDVERLFLVPADIDPPKDLPQDPATLAKWQRKAIAQVEEIARNNKLHIHVINSGGGVQVLAPLAAPRGAGNARRYRQRYAPDQALP
jgi:hypothetical protein